MLVYCPSCKEKVPALVEARYEGLKKSGETRSCPLCGTELGADSGIRKSKPGGGDPLSALFGDDPEPENISLFDVEAETAKICRKCRNYVLHPFTQRCSLHDREVSATDSCDQFQAPSGED